MSVGNVQVVELPSHFSQVQLAGLKDIVDHHIDNGHTVQFNASEMDRIDGSAIQFLLALSTMQSKTEENHAIVVNTNEVLTKALKDMGVADLIKTESNNNEESESQLSDE